MELQNKSQAAVTKYSGRDTIIVPTGKTLKIETSPQGEEILSVEVPAGKTWEVDISIGISES